MLDDAGDDGDVNANAEPAETVGAFLAAGQANGDFGSLQEAGPASVPFP
jgi:hypothetical protein